MSRIVLTHNPRHVWQRLSFSVSKKNMKTRLITLLALASPLLAMTQTWTMSGSVAGTINTGAVFTVGQRWNAKLHRKLFGPVGDSGASYSGYENAASSLFFSTPGYSLSAPSSTAWFYVYDESVYGIPTDLLEASFHSPSGPLLAGKAPTLFQFMLRDSDRSSISGTAIPNAINLDSWTNDNNSFFYWGSGPGRSELILTIDTISIPEPSSYSLLAGGASLLYIFRRRTNRANRVPMTG